MAKEKVFSQPAEIMYKTCGTKNIKEDMYRGGIKKKMVRKIIVVKCLSSFNKMFVFV